MSCISKRVPSCPCWRCGASPKAFGCSSTWNGGEEEEEVSPCHEAGDIFRGKYRWWCFAPPWPPRLLQMQAQSRFRQCWPWLSEHFMLYVPVQRDANQPGNAAIANSGSFRSGFQPRAATRHITAPCLWVSQTAAGGPTGGQLVAALLQQPRQSPELLRHRDLLHDLGSVLVRSDADYTPSLCPGTLLNLISLPHRHLSHHGTETIFITAKLQLSHTDIIPGFIQLPYCSEFL